MKVLIDHPRAFESIATVEGRRTKLPVTRVDSELLAESLQLRDQRRNIERGNDFVVPAENFQESQDSRAWLIWPESEGWAMSGSQLGYHISSFEKDDSVNVRLRVLSQLDVDAKVEVSGGYGPVFVPVMPQCSWHVVDVGVINLDPAGYLSLELPDGVYVDEIYLS